MKRYLIGVDIGTSGTKCILADERGEIIASALNEYPLSTPKTGWAEQNPEDWWRATIEGLRRITSRSGVGKAEIAGISFSGQMHGLVALDADMGVIRPAILWCDQRTQKQCDDITAIAGGLTGLLGLTNNRMLTGYTGGKILWLRENEPEHFEKMKVFLNPKDYIRYKLTGVIATDVSDASGTGLFDVKQRKWSYPLIDALELNKDIFPQVLESSDESGRVTAQAASLTGLPEGLKVYAGGGDAVIQTTGMGLVKQGVMGVVIGTSGVVAMGLDGYKRNTGGALQVFCNNAPDLWHAMGVTLAAGGSYRWYRDALCSGELEYAKANKKNVYDIMGEAAASAPPGSNKLLFLPYLIGERCPHSDPNARGAFVGLTLNHEKGDITRAVMEGITYSLKQVGELIVLMDKGISTQQVIASGGGAQSSLWRQIIADIFQKPVVTLSGSGEGGAYGAVLVAGVGSGIWRDLPEAIGVLRQETTNIPNPDNKQIYQDMYGTYTQLYHALKPSFDKLAAMNG